MRVIVLFTVCALSVLAVKAQKTGEDGEPNQLTVYVPNAFTPNFDGVNDVFKPVIAGPSLDFYELIILDRLGKQVFYSSDPKEVWNGSVKGDNYLSGTNIFVYFMKLKTIESIDPQTFQGHVVMVR